MFHAPCFGDEDFPILNHSNTNTDHSKIIPESKQKLYESLSENYHNETTDSISESTHLSPVKLEDSLVNNSNSIFVKPISFNDNLDISINQIKQSNILEHDYTLTSESSAFLHQEQESMDSSEDSDDNTPLSQMAISMKPTAQINNCEEVLKCSTKRRKVNYSDDPQKPVSAYALFFRDTQAAIKGQNSNTTFGEVSKIVASMWESLSNDEKQIYKKKTDSAKKLYLKKLSTLRADHIYKESLDHIKSEDNLSLISNSTNLNEAMSENSKMSFLETTNQDNKRKILQKSQTSQMVSSINENYITSHCLRNGCSKKAINNKFWDNEYCSSECLVNHCRCVFEEWITATQVQQVENILNEMKY